MTQHRAVIYARYSSDLQRQESIEDQIEVCRRYAEAQNQRAALETLAIIAHQQPVTRPQIDSIRGVNSDSMMKSLLSKNLILESGRADGPGRPILYSTTPEFLQHFGLNSILEMPPLARPEEEESKQNELLKG